MLLKRLVTFSMLLTFLVVGLGAYTRLADAGLGCPDWPGCYGHWDVPKDQEEILQANQAFPERPVETDKAWLEMIHRYFASTLGLCIVLIVLAAWREKQHNPKIPFKLPCALLGLVIFQGLLGMWTVTLGLYPPVVMAHLLGGFTTLSLLWVLRLRLKTFQSAKPVQAKRPPTPQQKTLVNFAQATLFVLVAQIALGGWTSSNYAAIICTEFPLCHEGWSQHLDLKEAFKIHKPAGDLFEFGLHLSPEAKITIHVMHRIGAILATAALITLSLLVFRHGQSRRSRTIASGLLIILALQVTLGVSNIVFSLPLSVAVAHNLVAALLLLAVITLLVNLYGEQSWKKPSTNLTH